MIRLLSGIAISAMLIFAPTLVQSAEVAKCVPGSELQSRFVAEKIKDAKQVWLVKPEGMAKINQYFGTEADTGILVYFGGDHLGIGLWACGKPLEGYSRDMTYSQMSFLMRQIQLKAEDVALIKGIDA